MKRMVLITLMKFYFTEAGMTLGIENSAVASLSKRKD